MSNEYREIKGYDGKYIINRQGDIISNYTHIYLKQRLRKNGYLDVGLHKNGETERPLTHRLIAQCFIPNPYNHPTVDHIDGDRTNNDIDNLRWADYNTQAINRKYVVDSELPNHISYSGDKKYYDVRIQKGGKYFHRKLFKVSDENSLETAIEYRNSLYHLLGWLH